MAVWIAADKQQLTITLQCKTINELSGLLHQYEDKIMNLDIGKHDDNLGE